MKSHRENFQSLKNIDKVIQINPNFEKLFDTSLPSINTSNCTVEEKDYFCTYYKKSVKDPEEAWDNLNLQEQMVINSLSIEHLPAYLGYRQQVKYGLPRRVDLPKPLFALIELVSACNIKCPFCFQSDPSFTTPDFMGHMDIDLALRIIDELDELKVRAVTFASRGEPLLHRDLAKILDHLKNKDNIFEIKINTNAKRLTQQKLDQIINSRVNILVVSTDHYEKNQYEKFRHGAVFESFLNNINNINFSRALAGREQNLYTRASGVKVDTDMDINQYNQFYKQFFDEVGLVNLSERWNTYANEIDEKHMGSCHLPFEKLYIWHDGTTNPCDMDYKSYLSPGKYGELTLKQCWDSMGTLRQRLLDSERNLITPCDRCHTIDRGQA